MTNTVTHLAKKLQTEGVSSDCLIDLAISCRERAKSEGDAIFWLGLDAFFRKMGASISDRPVQTSETDELSRSLNLLFVLLAESTIDENRIRQSVNNLRHLI